MKPNHRSSPVIAWVVFLMLVLAVLSYLLPGTLAAYMFPGIARISAVEPGQARPPE